MPDTPLLTASIVTYNSEQHIRNVLSSLLDSTIAHGLEITVVDNASADQTAEIVEKEFPAVRLIRLQKNIGFGQGHNQVLPYMAAPCHVIVNPDITVAPDTLEKMAAFMAGRPEVALLTPRVLHPNGSEQFLPKELPSLRFLMGGYLERLGRPFTAWREVYTWKNAGVFEPRECSFATGCFMFVRTAALKAAGGFDPRYFLYMEDADLTREMQKQGKVLYHPGFSVTHVWNRESSRSLHGTRLHLASILRYFGKWGLRV